jgi:hypothetical protein
MLENRLYRRERALGAGFQAEAQREDNGLVIALDRKNAELGLDLIKTALVIRNVDEGKEKTSSRLRRQRHACLIRGVLAKRPFPGSRALVTVSVS